MEALLSAIYNLLLRLVSYLVPLSFNRTQYGQYQQTKRGVLIKAPLTINAKSSLYAVQACDERETEWVVKCAPNAQAMKSLAGAGPTAWSVSLGISSGYDDAVFDCERGSGLTGSAPVLLPVAVVGSVIQVHGTNVQAWIQRNADAGPTTLQGILLAAVPGRVAESVVPGDALTSVAGVASSAEDLPLFATDFKVCIPTPLVDDQVIVFSANGTTLQTFTGTFSDWTSLHCEAAFVKFKGGAADAGRNFCFQFKVRS